MLELMAFLTLMLCSGHFDLVRILYYAGYIQPPPKKYIFLKFLVIFFPHLATLVVFPIINDQPTKTGHMYWA